MKKDIISCLSPFLLLACHLTAPSVSAAPADLDTTFNESGIIRTRNLGTETFARDMLVQPDGRIVVVGAIYNEVEGVYNFLILRYEADGTPDNTLNGTGMVTTHLGPGNAVATGVALRSNGEIVVVGTYEGDASSIALVCYGPTGVLNPNFNDTGIVITAVGAGNSAAFDLAVQENDQIVVAGYSYVGSLSGTLVARYRVDGSLDPMFNGTGVVVTPISGSSCGGNSMVLQDDEKIVVAGYSSAGAEPDFALFRYNTDGTLDATFNGTGIVTTGIGDYETANCVALQADGKIVAGGYTSRDEDRDFALVRYNTNGSLDTTFDGDGIVTSSLGGAEDIIEAVAVQPDGKILATGQTLRSAAFFLAVARYLPNGTLEADFGEGGVLTESIDGENSFGQSILVQDNGRILVAGRANDISVDQLILLRYRGGSLNPPRPPVIDNQHLKVSLSNKISKVVKAIKNFRKKGQTSKVSRLNLTLKKLKRQLRAL